MPSYFHSDYQLPCALCVFDNVEMSRVVMFLHALSLIFTLQSLHLASLGDLQVPCYLTSAWEYC